MILENKEQVKELAQQMAKENAKDIAIQKKELENIIKEIEEETAEDKDGLNAIASLLSLPEDKFALLAPTFLEEIELSYNDPNQQMLLLQVYNLKGITEEDLKQDVLLFESKINELGNMLSSQKKDFLKQLVHICYNSTAGMNGIAKKFIHIPIEYCHPNAKMPAYANPTDAGMDVYALEDITIAPGETKIIPTGIKVAIPAGYEIQIRSKSGRCVKTKLRVANQPGTIDAGYREEIGVIIDNIEPFIKSADIDENGRLYNVLFGQSYTIGKGEKFAQLVLNEVPKAVFYEVSDIKSIEGDGRNGGYGSTGLK